MSERRKRTCPGPCSPDGEPFPHYCGGCIELAKSWLTDIDSSCAIIAFSADGYSKDTSYGKIRAGKGSTVAGSVSVAADVLLTIGTALTEWMRAERSTVRRFKHASPITEACSWISMNIDSYMCKAWQGGAAEADRFFRDIRSIWQQTQRLASVSGESVLKPLPCPRSGCGKPALAWRPGGKVVRCTVCGKMLTLEQYEDLVMVVLEAEQARIKGRKRAAKAEPAEPAELIPAPRQVPDAPMTIDIGAARSAGMLFSEDRCDMTELYISQCGHCREKRQAG